MRKIFLIVTLIAALAVGVAWDVGPHQIPLFGPESVHAQTALTSTVLTATLSASGSANRMTVSSATGFTASSGTTDYLVYVDRELMRVQAVSGTTITVQRGLQRTAIAAHLSGALVWVGPATSFAQTDPIPGNCTSAAASQQYSPVINVVNGNMWECTSITTAANAISAPGTPTTYGIWQLTNFVGAAYSFPYRTVVNAAYTAKYTDVVIEYISMTAGRTVTLPAVTQIYGKIYIIKHNAATTTLTVAVTSGQYILTLGTTSTSLFNGDVLRLISTGGGYVTW